ncbi:MAG: four-helix bundle copper-binding protein [Tepidisphaeraceae bacterium]
MSHLRDCIDQCSTCHQVCLETLTHCLRKGGDHAAADHVRLMQDCIQICATSADFMLRGSELHTETCRACAEVCRRCAEDCERLADDDMMRRCADQCRSCAESCAHMAGVAA